MWVVSIQFFRAGCEGVVLPRSSFRLKNFRDLGLTTTSIPAAFLHLPAYLGVDLHKTYFLRGLSTGRHVADALSRGDLESCLQAACVQNKLTGEKRALENYFRDNPEDQDERVLKTDLQR